MLYLQSFLWKGLSLGYVGSIQNLKDLKDSVRTQAQQDDIMSGGDHSAEDQGYSITQSGAEDSWTQSGLGKPTINDAQIVNPKR
jgi:hypothetical protein